MSNKTPILLIIFNRPETTQRVFDIVKEYKPKMLFIAADGPRKSKIGEDVKCNEARKITENIDWPCKVKRLYQRNNLGCGVGPYKAISWFFKNVKEGIILEDDCLPDISFFQFCSEMLAKYRNIERIMHIGGNNFQKPYQQNAYTYYFSKYPQSWGWATWRRAWEHYDFEMKDWPIVKKLKKFDIVFNSYMEKKYWHTIFDFNFYFKNKDIWDYQWVYAIWKNSGMAIIPDINLVKNIGFNSNATHTTNILAIAKNLTLNKMRFPLKHPKSISVDKLKDAYLFKNGYNNKLITMVYIFVARHYKIWQSRNLL